MKMEDMKFNARTFARLGEAGSIFGLAAPAWHDKYNLVCLSADMTTRAGLDRFRKAYPNDFYNAGIAEQNLLGMAAGLTSEGYKSVCTAQACFLTMRSCEPMRQYMGYMGLPIVLVGLSAGLALQFLGNTHYAIEDIAITRSIPNMYVFSPADAGMAVKIFEKALELNIPAYIRLTQGLMPPIVYKEDFLYNPFKINEVFNGGNDVTILATGSMVYPSIQSAELLKNEGICCRVLDVHCIKPLDKETIVNALNSKLLVSVEEHTIVGGLGSAIAEVLSENINSPRLLRLGINDCFSTVGDYPYLLQQHRLTPELIAEDIRKNV